MELLTKQKITIHQKIHLICFRIYMKEMMELEEIKDVIMLENGIII